MSYTSIIQDLQALASAEKAKNSARFFKSGPGQYGEGDQFIGATVPEQRTVARRYRHASLDDIERLLQSPIHEYRLTALLLLVDQYQRGDEATRAAGFELYMANTRWVNNWDLVDASAGYIVGPQAELRGEEVLTQLARSANLWERRIAVVACFHFIKQGQSDTAFRIIGLLQNDPHDLIQKAVGWMLREIGKRCGRQQLTSWLGQDRRYQTLPRTTLRYAIEHFSPAERQAYLSGQA